MREYKLNKGFTLLEVFLVIAVIAIISVSAINALRIQSQEEVYNKSISDMQNLLQAATRFFLVSYKNDITSYCLGATDITSALVGNKYLASESLLCSPWPGNSGLAACPNKAAYQVNCATASKQYFSVVVQVDDPNSRKKLAGLLPSAVIKNNQVIAYRSMPDLTAGISAEMKKGWIVTSGVVEGKKSPTSKHKIYMPLCPDGFEGHYIQTYRAQRTGHRHMPSGKHRVVALQMKKPPVVSPTTNPHVRIRNYANYAEDIPGLDDKGDVDVSDNFYITMCLPKGTWLASDAKSSREAQKGKCWDKYHNGEASC